MFGWLRKLFGRSREEELVALVLLIETPRFLDREPSRAAIERATGHRLTDETFKTEGPSYHRFWLDGYEMTLCSSPAPYVPNPEQLAQEFGELRLRDAVGRHRACVLVDVWKAPPGKRREDALGTMGKILAEFFDDTALSVYSRVTHRHNIVSEDLERRFREGNAAEAMETLAFDGITLADGEDPRMIAAVNEARQRWPEFERSWRGAEDRNAYIVKVPFADGDYVEHMWVTPTAIEGTTVKGVLMSQPFNLARPRQGDEVTFSTEELTDWIYAQDGKAIGGFTEALVRGG
jgi:uncharacterized protein YegJ (DUF2314 family)